MTDAVASLLVLVLLGALACGPAEAPTGDAPATAEASATSPDPTSPGQQLDTQALTRDARLLAGLDDAGGKAPWGEHAARMDTLWALIEARHLGAMEAWARRDFTAISDPTLPLFYPFGGPDLPSVQQFFPDARAYLLVGLEPPGALPRLDGVDDERLGAELERLRVGFLNLAEKGYFVAKHMEADFAARHLEGFLPVLYIALARSGQRPLAVRFFALDDDGTPRYLDAVTPETARNVEITFVAADGGEGDAGEDGAAPRRLVYLAQDLSNDGFAATPGFAPYVRSFAPMNVYMKAAMYLPHGPAFSDLETLVLDHAQTLLEEDSGIPYAALDDRFEVTLFGAYEATLPNYREYFQPDLRDAYDAADPEPLPFEIGYNSRIAGSCLIWAERRDDG